MSRSGYSDSLDNSALFVWRGIIASATRGKRGQRFFRELVTALDAMPVKALVAGELQTTDGEVCALGALGRHKGVDIGTVDTYDHDALGAAFDIASQLSQEVMYENDDGCLYFQDPSDGQWKRETPEHRWKRVRAWAEAQIKSTDAAVSK